MLYCRDNDSSAFWTLVIRIDKFVTIVWDNLNVYVYLNGALGISHNYTTPYLLANSNAILYIGDPWFTANGGIQIKNFCIYNVSLNTKQVTNIYNNQINVNLQRKCILSKPRRKCLEVLNRDQRLRSC